MKPGSLLQLRTGKLLDTFNGFVDFFNWMARFLFRLRSRGSIQTTKDADDTYYLDIKGFPSADSGSMPMKNSDGSMDWISPDNESVTTHDKKLKIFGFYDAPNQTVACKRDGVITFVDESEIGGGGGSVSVTGTDGVTVTGNAIVLQSESDSNVTAKATVSGGVITLKIGVYWV